MRERKREQVWWLYRWEYSEKMHMLLKYMTVVLIVDDNVSALILLVLSFSLFLYYKKNMYLPISNTTFCIGNTIATMKYYLLSRNLRK